MKRRKRRKNQSMINYRLERRTKIGNPEERRKERMLENAIPIGEREKKKGKKKKKKRHRGQKGKVIVGMKERKKKERRLELVTITSVIEFDRHPFPLSLSLSHSLSRVADRAWRQQSANALMETSVIRVYSLCTSNYPFPPVESRSCPHIREGDAPPGSGEGLARR